jgi:hypothetical protein
MDVHFLYFDDCPSHEGALQRLKTVLAEENVAAEVRITQVETEDQAQQHQFIGSPTIRLDGEDIVPPPAEAQYHLACRVYRWPDGRFSPMPSPDMIRSAIRKATQKG